MNGSRILLLYWLMQQFIENYPFHFFFFHSYLLYTWNTFWLNIHIFWLCSACNIYVLNEWKRCTYWAASFRWYTFMKLIRKMKRIIEFLCMCACVTYGSRHNSIRKFGFLIEKLVDTIDWCWEWWQLGGTMC